MFPLPYFESHPFLKNAQCQTHLSADLVYKNTLCSNHIEDSEQCQCADESMKVEVQLCENGHGGNFYIHRFDEISMCASAICVQNNSNNITGEYISMVA